MKTVTPIERTIASEWFADELASVAREHAPGPAQTALVERRAPEGAMPPLHTRSETETYRVLEGEVTFYIDHDVVPASPGDVVVAPAGVARSFCAETDARWLVFTRVHSLEYFVDFGRAVARPRDGRPSAEERAALHALAAANGIELIGPPGFLPGAAR
jgi:mannose-6-phosphate isomerase-like protein (cupin superfamily)